MAGVARDKEGGIFYDLKKTVSTVEMGDVASKGVVRRQIDANLKLATCHEYATLVILFLLVMVIAIVVLGSRSRSICICSNSSK